MSIPRGTIVRWNIKWDYWGEGEVLTGLVTTGRVLVRMDAEFYAPDEWPGGLRYFRVEDLEVVK